MKLIWVSLIPIVCFKTTHPRVRCAGWDLADPLALTTSRLSVVKVLPDVPLTQATSEYVSKAFLCVWYQKKRLFPPFIQAQDQNSRSWLGSVWRSLVWHIYWGISLHLFFLALTLLVHEKILYLMSSIFSLLQLSDTSELALNKSHPLCSLKASCEPVALSPFSCHLKSYLKSCSTSIGKLSLKFHPVMHCSETRK